MQFLSYGLFESNFDGLVDDRSDGVCFEVFFHGFGFSKTENIAVVELPIAAQRLVQCRWTDAVEHHVVECAGG